MLSLGQIRAARAFLGLSQLELAQRADVSLPTVQRLENPEQGPETSSVGIVRKVKEALEASGVVFFDPSDGMGEGLRLRSASDGMRQRVRRPRRRGAPEA